MSPNVENTDQATTSPAAASEVAVLRERLSKQSAEIDSVKSQLTEMTELLRAMVSRQTIGQTSEGIQQPQVARQAMATAQTVTAPGPSIVQVPIAPMATTPRQETSAPAPAAMAEGGSNTCMDHGEVFADDFPGAEPNTTYQIPSLAKEPQSWREEVEKLIKEKIGEGQPSQTKNLESFFMFPKVELPPKFKVPQFTKYKGDGNPEYHLRHYCTKLGALTRDEGVLLLYFHESLEGPAYNWYMQLDHSTIKTWGDMAETFRKYYRHNMKNAATRDQVRAMKMKTGESFRAYAARWRQLAMEVRPVMDEKEMITYFVRTLPDPFYGIMLGSHACEFSDLIETGDLIDMEAKEGRLGSIAQPYKKGPNVTPAQRKKEGEVNFVHQAPVNPSPGYNVVRFSNQYNRPSQAATPTSRPFQASQPRFQRETRPMPKIGVTNSQLYQELLKQKLIGPRAARPVVPPYPSWYKPELTCEYHMGAPGHSIENCEAFRSNIWTLIDNKVVAFEGAGPNIQNNPLPGHDQDRRVAAVVEDEHHVREVSALKCSRAALYEKLARAGHYPVIERPAAHQFCSFHRSSEHDIEDCPIWEGELNKLMALGVIVLTKREPETGACATLTSSQEGPTLRIRVPCSTEAVEQEMAALSVEGEGSKSQGVYIIRAATVRPALSEREGPQVTFCPPAPFPYRSNRAVPWRYDTKIKLASQGMGEQQATGDRQRIGDHKEDSDRQKAVNQQKAASANRIGGQKELASANVTGERGITRSGRVFNKEAVAQKGPVGAGEEEGEEFLQIMRQSDYSVVDQLKKTPSKISLYSLIMSSEAHRKALQAMLGEAHVQPNTSPEQMINLVSASLRSPAIMFTEEEVHPNMFGRPKALHITAKCLGSTVAGILIDGGSALNVLPLTTLEYLPVDLTSMGQSNMIVRAFDGSRKEALGEITLPLQIGPSTFKVEFQVMEFESAYSMLLGRPWIHAAHAVPSTLHQKIKYIEEGKTVTIEAEESILISRSTSTPYVENVEQASESSFQCFEEEKLSNTVSQVAANIMAKQGYQAGKGLGPKLEGIPQSLELVENSGRRGLGFGPEAELQASKRSSSSRASKGKAKEGIPHLQVTFPGAAEIINAEGDQHIARAATKIEEGGHAEPSNVLTNWKAEPVLIVFNE